MPVSTLKAACVDISLPWSQVIERSIASGSVAIFRCMVSRTASVLRSPGRWTSTTKRVVRSTKVATWARAGPAEDEVAVKVAGDGSVLDLGGTLGDADRVDDAATLAPAGVRSLLAPAGSAASQRLDELGPKPSAALDVEGLVDRLVRHLPGWLSRMLETEAVGDLIR